MTVGELKELLREYNEDDDERSILISTELGTFEISSVENEGDDVIMKGE